MPYSNNKRSNMDEESDDEVEEKPKLKDVKEVRPIPKGDKVYQIVRAEILVRDKQRSKAPTRGDRRQEQFIDKTRQAVAASGTRDLKADVKRNAKKDR